MAYWIKKVERDPNCHSKGRHYVEVGYRYKNYSQMTDINVAHSRLHEIEAIYSQRKCFCKCIIVDHSNDPIM